MWHQSQWKGLRMDKRIFGFKRCDKKLYEYLDKALDRMPPDIKEKILENNNLEILTDDSFQSAQGLHYIFNDSQGKPKSVLFADQIDNENPEPLSIDLSIMIL